MGWNESKLIHTINVEFISYINDDGDDDFITVLAKYVTLTCIGSRAVWGRRLQPPSPSKNLRGHAAPPGGVLPQILDRGVLQRFVNPNPI